MEEWAVARNNIRAIVAVNKSLPNKSKSPDLPRRYGGQVISGFHVNNQTPI
jgi:hypothetical protein